MVKNDSTNRVEIGERLRNVRVALKVSQEEFGKRLAGDAKPIDKATISKYEKGLMEISSKAKVELYTTLAVRKEYLEEGVEPMFTLNESASTDSRRGFHRNARQKGVPVDFHVTKGGNQFVELSEGDYVMYPHRVTVKARAGYLVGWGDTEYVDSLPVYPAVVKDLHKGYYLWFDIDGDSMDDGSKRSIEDRSMALGRQINRSLWKSKFHIKDYPFFIIVHISEGIICKEIIHHDTEKGCIICHSLNPNKEMYPDFEIKLDECIQIFNVVKIERDAKA